MSPFAHLTPAQIDRGLARLMADLRATGPDETTPTTIVEL